MSILQKIKNLLIPSTPTEHSLKEMVYTTNKKVTIKDVGENNSFDNFLKSLTPEQNSTDILLLPDDLIYQSVVALYNFQHESIPSSQECVNKALVLMAASLYGHKMSNFNLEYTFKGSKVDVKEEQFIVSFSSRKADENFSHVENEKNPEDSKTDIELTFSEEKDLKTPKEKISQLIEQKENVLTLVKNIKEHLPDEQGLYISYFAANLLIVMESISLLNAEDFKVELNDIIVKNESTGTSFDITIKRIEIENTLVAKPSRKKM